MAAEGRGLRSWVSLEVRRRRSLSQSALPYLTFFFHELLVYAVDTAKSIINNILDLAFLTC
jgi:hypothetical protein